MLMKLALRNVRRSVRDYAVYFVTLTLGVAVFYAFNAIGDSRVLFEAQEGAANVFLASGASIFDILVLVMTYFSIVVAVVLGFLVLYANRFVVRARKKEFGTYLLLGMNPRQVSSVVLMETLIVGEDSFTICERNDAHNAFALYDEMKTHPRTFSIVDCPRLVAVVVGNGSFASFTDCTIQRCPMLQNLQIGTPDKCDDYRNRSYAFFNCQTLVLKDLPGLEGVLLGNYAFYHCSSVVFYSGGGGVS